jgi:hypothetical protein
MAFKIRRGTNAERAAYTPAIGEPIWTTDTKKLWIGDGVTQGGIPADAESYLDDEYLQDLTAGLLSANPNAFNGVIANAAGSGPYTASITILDSITGLQVGQTLTKVSGVGNFGLDNTCVITAVISANNSISVSSVDAFTNGSIKFVSNITNPHNGITFTYNDVTGKITATVNFPTTPSGPVSGGNFSFNVTGTDSTLKTVNNSETIQFIGQNGILVNVNDIAGTTVVNIDGSGVAGGGGDANLEDVGWFVTGADSTQTRIRNDETLQFLGDNGITIAVDDTLAPARLTITSPVNINSGAVFAIPYYSAVNSSSLSTSGPDLRYMTEYGTLETNVVAATTIASVLITDPFNITNIQPNTPIAGRATVTFGPAHPHPPYYNQRYLKIEGVTGLGSSWNAVYETRPGNEGDASTINTVIIQSSNSTAYTSGGTIRETTTRGIGIFPTGEDPFINLGGTLEFNNGIGPVEYGAKLRILDNQGFGLNNNFNSVEFVQIHNDADANAISLVKGRGTFNATTKVLAGDTLGSIVFSGLDGVNAIGLNGYPTPASVAIFAEAAETPGAIPGAPSIAGKLFFQTASPGSGYTLYTGLEIDEYQTVSIPSKIVVSDTVQIAGNLIQTINSNANLDLRANGTGTINLLDAVNVSGILNVGTINVSTLDTSDSSAITFTPAVVFNSDVTVENDLTVTNKIYASEFVSSSLGSAEIITPSDFKIKVATKEFEFDTSGVFKLPVLTAAPGSPISGMVAVADGTGWNPLGSAGKEQMVVYLGGGWRQIAVEP